MRNLIAITILPFVLFVQCTNSRSRIIISDLPNDTLIEEALTSVILLDSIFNAHLGNNQLFIPYIYYTPKWDKNNPYPPPPPPLPPISKSFRYSHGFSFDEAFKYLKSSTDIEQRNRDSLYIIQQVDTTKNHNISKSILSLFKNEKDDYYWFSLPIFSNDKSTVIVTYSEEYYFGYITVLKKVEGNWTKVYHDLTWMR